ncbi:unnamed protein product [Prunus armeniaca]
MAPPPQPEEMRLSPLTLAFFVHASLAVLIYVSFPSVYSYSLLGLTFMWGVPDIITHQNPYFAVLWGILLIFWGIFGMLLTCPCACVQ